LQATVPAEISATPEAVWPERAQTQVRRLPVLDVLRAVALLLVMGRHMQVVEPWYRLGWLGVHLFFVISGFLVSGLLFSEYRKTGGLDVRRFLIRRAFKIYPAFWLLLLVTLPVAYLSPIHPTPGQIVSELLFLQSYAPGYWEHTWSLAVEEHFYLVLAGGLLLMLRRRGTSTPFAAIPRATLAVCAACLAARIVTVATLPFGHLTHVYATHIRLDALVFGVCLSYWFHFHREAWALFMTRNATRLWLLSAACLVPLASFEITTSPFVLTLGLTLGYVGLGALLMAAIHARSHVANSPTGAWHVAQRVLGWLGRNSYGIYLWHMVVALWAVGKFKTLFAPAMPYSLELVIYFSGSIALGVAATQLLERPLLDLRDRWYPSRNAV